MVLDFVKGIIVINLSLYWSRPGFSPHRLLHCLLALTIKYPLFRSGINGSGCSPLAFHPMTNSEIPLLFQPTHLDPHSSACSNLVNSLSPEYWAQFQKNFPYHIDHLICLRNKPFHVSKSWMTPFNTRKARRWRRRDHTYRSVLYGLGHYLPCLLTPTLIFFSL